MIIAKDNTNKANAANVTLNMLVSPQNNSMIMKRRELSISLS